MSKFVKARYDTDKECYVNMDYIIDIFPYGMNEYIAYTTTRNKGYIISDEDFKEIPH